MITAVRRSRFRGAGFPALVAVVAWLLFAGACSSGRPTPEQRADALDRALMCPVCPGETIDQSSVQIAKDMRRIVREKLAAGETEGEIKDFFVARYGTRILAAPPASGFTSLVWILPPALLAAGAGTLVLVLRDMRRRRMGTAGPTAPADDLAPYLDAVDAELTASGERGRDGEDSSRVAGQGNAEG